MTLKERYEKEIKENDRRNDISTTAIAVAIAISVILLFPSFWCNIALLVGIGCVLISMGYFHYQEINIRKKYIYAKSGM